MPSVRYLATLHGHTEQVPVEVEDKGEGRLALLLDGQRHEVDALPLEHGAVSLLIDGRVYDVEFDDVGEEVQVLVRGDVFSVDVADERSLRLRAGSATLKVEGRVTLTAPMPGKVVRMLVKQGEAVRDHGAYEIAREVGSAEIGGLRRGDLAGADQEGNEGSIGEPREAHTGEGRTETWPGDGPPGESGHGECLWGPGTLDVNRPHLTLPSLLRRAPPSPPNGRRGT